MVFWEYFRWYPHACMLIGSLKDLFTGEYRLQTFYLEEEDLKERIDVVLCGMEGPSSHVLFEVAKKNAKLRDFMLNYQIKRLEDARNYVARLEKTIEDLKKSC